MSPTAEGPTPLPRCAECKKLARPRDELLQGDNIHDHAGTHLMDTRYTHGPMYLVLPVHREWV